MPGWTDADRHRQLPRELDRPRLLAPFVDENAPGVVVVIAPPGSGKTTLLSVAGERSHRPAAWYVARPEDRDGRDFVRNLAQATAKVTGAELGHAESAAELIRALEALPEQELLLLMDDVHELEGFSAERELADLLLLRPRHVRLALGTRRPLASNTPRLMVSGDLIELDSEALRFRSWEVEELFRLVYAEPLSPEGAAALTRRTGGWAAGLMLFHLSTTGKSAVERERAVADLGGRSRLIRSYLTRTVLDELDPERREFLLATCTLGILTGPLCDALLQREGCAAVLEDLASRQFFTKLDENGRSYRYHQVLQTLLEVLLVDELGQAAASDLYTRSALLLESQGLPREALRAFAMAEDFGSVARVLQQTGAGLTMDPQVAIDDAIDDPWLALVHARRLQRSGDFAAAVTAFHEAETLLDDAEFRRRCGEERTAAQVWTVDANIPNQPGPGVTAPRAAVQAIRAATRRLPAFDRMPSQPLAEGIVRLLSGDVEGAARKLAHITAGSPPERLCADLSRVVAEIADGADDDPVATLEETVLSADVEEQPWLARVARGLQAAVLLATSDEPWRVGSCESLVEECERSGDVWGEALLAGSLGVAHVLRGDPAADRWLDRAAACAHSLNAPVLAAWAESISAFAARQRGAPDADARATRARSLARTAGVVDAEVLLARRLHVGAVVTRPDRGVVIRCLGQFGIEVAGAPLDLPPLRPLPRTLLLLLVLHHERGIHREVLVDLLWPGTPLETAAHRLHAAASSVRRCLAGAGLGDDVLRRTGGGYRLHLEHAVVDVVEFESSLRDASRREAQGDQRGALAADLKALELYRGDLLGEAGPAEWVVPERERLRVAAAGAAYSAAQLSLRWGNPAGAVPLARRATELDPLRDSAWALLAEVQERMGDLGSAAATRREQLMVVAELTAQS